MIKKLIIIGNGGHSQVVQSIVKITKEYQLVEVWDDKYLKEEIIDNVRYRAIPSNKVLEEKMSYLIAIGDNQTRISIEKHLKLTPDDYATIIHPTATIDTQSTIKSGSVIMANAVVQVNSFIGHHSIINTSVVVEHDAVIGNFVHLSPSVTLTGNCQIEDCTFVGAGSTLIPAIRIGKNVVIGAGSVVLKSLPSNTIAYGNPARVK